MASTIKEMIDIHLRAGFTRGSVHSKYGFSVYIESNGDQLLIVNAMQGWVTIYTYDARGNFKDYGTVEIAEQAWARKLREGSYYRDAYEVRLDRENNSR